MQFEIFYEETSKVLCEAPYRWEGNYEPDHSEYQPGDRLSNRQLNAKNASYLGSVAFEHEKVKLYTSTHGDKLIVEGYYPVDPIYNDRIFVITLDGSQLPGIGFVYTVKNVQTVKQYQMGGLATAIYLYFVKQDKLILSDSNHYEGAINLWKNLARNSKEYGVTVTRYDMTTKELTAYDGHNIPDDQIWGTDAQYHPNVRLLLRV